MSDQLEMGGGGLRPARPSILALDMSLTGFGWCFNGKTGVIRSRQKGWDRVAEITQVVFRMTFGVDVVVIEDFPWGVQGKSVVQLAELRGIVLFWLYQHAMPTVLINTSTLKKYGTGAGNAGKPQMLLAAQHRFHLPEQTYDDNEVDAFLLYCFAREAYGGPIATVPADRAALAHRLTWPEIRRDAA